MSPVPEPGDFAAVLESPAPPHRFMEFPTHVLPAPVRGFVRRVAEALPCPEDYVGVACLVAAGTLIGRSHVVEVKGGWPEQASIYAAIVGSPGVLKSPAMKAALRPFKEVARTLLEDFRSREEAWRVEHAKYKLLLQVWKQRQRELAKDAAALGVPPALEDPPACPPRPRLEKVWTGDVTTEELGSMLEGSRGVLLFRDEIAGWVRDMNRYSGGSGGDREKFLTAWGGEWDAVDRKGASEKPLLLDHAFLSILGGVQPDLLGVFKEREGKQDGFKERLLLSYPQTDRAPALNDLVVDAGVLASWRACCWALRELPYLDEGRRLPRVVPMTSAAWSHFLSWHEDVHRAEIRSPGFQHSLDGVWSKFKAYCARFALVSRCLRWACSGAAYEPSSFWVEEEDVAGAVTLVNYFKDHYRGCLGLFDYDPDDRLVRDFAAWMRGGGRAKVTQRDVRRTQRFGKGSSDVLGLFKKMEDRGLGYYVRAPKGSVVFHLTDSPPESNNHALNGITDPPRPAGDPGGDPDPLPGETP